MSTSLLHKHGYFQLSSSRILLLGSREKCPDDYIILRRPLGVGVGEISNTGLLAHHTWKWHEKGKIMVYLSKYKSFTRKPPSMGYRGKDILGINIASR